MNFNLICGNSLEELKKLEDNSIDSIVTDPPYELGFMGKHWDKSGIAYNKDLWAECLRVLKPGGHLLSFSGSRTYHRMTVAIEDAGFDIRDQIMWVYSSGFPKSTDVSKAIDKKRDDRDDSIIVAKYLLSKNTFSSVSKFRQYLNINIMNKNHSGGSAQQWTTIDINAKTSKRCPTIEQWKNIKILLNLDSTMDDLILKLNSRKGEDGDNFKNREVIGKSSTGASEFMGSKIDGKGNGLGNEVLKYNITAPSTPDAIKWQGWGTALKPAIEPICLARKPFKTTVAENVLKYGVGAINIDKSRIGDELIQGGRGGRKTASNFNVSIGEKKEPHVGRWPANFIHDGLNEEWAKYFYCPKASKKDRGEGNNHPTVKPTDLMAYLIRLVTPEGGTVLDPFNGSGSTGKACARLGFNYIGIDLSQEYLDISKARIENELNKK